MSHEMAFLGLCKNGNIDKLISMIETHCITEKKIYNGLIMATEHNQNKCVKELMKHVKCYLFNPVVIACKNGNLELVKLFVKNGIDVSVKNNELIRIACRNGHLNVVKWLYSNGSNIHACQEYGFRWGCYNGSFELVQWIYNNSNVNVNACNGFAIKNACKNNHMNIVKWLIQINAVHLDGAFMESCMNRNIHLMKYINSKIRTLYSTFKVSEIYRKIFGLCCKNNDCKTLKLVCHFAKKINVSFCVSKYFLSACLDGFYDIATYIYKHFQVNVYDGLLNAINKKHLDIAKFIINQKNVKYGLISDVFRKYCTLNNLQIVKWLHENVPNGIPNNILCRSFIDTCRTRVMDVSQWILSLGQIQNNYIFEYGFILCCQFGFLGKAKWLLGTELFNVRVQNDMAFCMACCNNRLHVVNWLSSLCKLYTYVIVDNDILGTVMNISELIEGNNYLAVIDDLMIDENKHMGGNNEPCVICYENKEYMSISSCNHIFCIECILTWTDGHSTCPYCRNNIVKNNGRLNIEWFSKKN
jgi:ankyrin repeat protein